MRATHYTYSCAFGSLVQQQIVTIDNTTYKILGDELTGYAVHVGVSGAQPMVRGEKAELIVAAMRDIAKEARSSRNAYVNYYRGTVDMIVYDREEEES